MSMNLGHLSGPTHSTSEHLNASARIEKWRKRTPVGRRKQTDAVRPTHSWPKCGRELGQPGKPRASARASSCPPLAHLTTRQL
jgi:hypothetical protein